MQRVYKYMISFICTIMIFGNHIVSLTTFAKAVDDNTIPFSENDGIDFICQTVKCEDSGNSLSLRKITEIAKSSDYIYSMRNPFNVYYRYSVLLL